MKTRNGLTKKERDHIIELKKSMSHQQIVIETGKPLGTSRSIVRKYNIEEEGSVIHNNFFTLPEPNPTNNKDFVVTELPKQIKYTNNKILDLVLWLREVIKTENPLFIEMALDDYKKIKISKKEIEDLYSKYLLDQGHSPFRVSFSVIGFCDLDRLADEVLLKKKRRKEAYSLFGENYMEFKTPQELFCDSILKDSDQDSDQDFMEFDKADYVPITLSDCVLELKFWGRLYLIQEWEDYPHSVSLREEYIKSKLGQIRPRSSEEAYTTYRYLIDDGIFEYIYDERKDILMRNLMNHK